MTACELLDVGEYHHALGAYRLAVAKQVARAGFYHALVGEMAKNEALGPYKIEPGRMSGGHGLAVGAGEYLNSARKFHGVFDLAADYGHRSDNFRAAGALDIWNVVHIFDHYGMDAGFFI